MTVLKILEEYLKANGFDGLAGDECGCEIGDLAPCENPLNCKPAYKTDCGGCDCGGDWCLTTDPKRKYCWMKDDA